MNPLIELLNFWGERFLSFAWPMLWQSGVLIVVLFVLDFAIRKHVRATVRYALWMLVLIKLVLPTSLSLPTSPGYWVQAPAVLDAALVIEIPRESPRRAPEPASILESNSDQPAAPVQERAESPLQSVATAATVSLERTPLLRWPAFIGLSWLVGAVALLFLVIHRGRLAWRLVADASDAPDEVQSLVGECARQLGASSRIAAKLTDALATPVVCGLFRPVILLPKPLASRLAPEQLQAVLLHELAHVRRGDLWVSHLQTALQILHFYNPLLWLANARIRRVREEAVDEMVLVALADNAEVYPETLLSVAKLSRQSPRLAFGLIGILESKRSLGARIRLMLLRPWPKSARLGVNGIIALLVLGAMLLPMSCAKDRRATPAVPGPTTPPQVSFEVKFVELPEEAARELREKLSVTNGSSAELRTSATNFWAFALTAPQAKGLLGSLESAPNTSVVSAPQVAAVSSGRQAHIEMTNLLRLITHPVVIDAPAGKMRYAEPPGISRQIPIGPMVDVRPVVSSDGYSLQLTIVPTITEFLGYNEPRMITIDSPVKAPDPLAPPTIAAIAAEERAARRTESIASSPLTAQLPSPRIRVRQLVTIANTLDGQPILLGGLISDPVQQVKEKVPVLGDLPMLGKLFRPESTADSKKSLLIFITPTIVNSAGNSVHSDADMPFRKNSIPPQKLSESPQAPEAPERKAHIEGTGAELTKVERVDSPERTTGAEITVPAQALPVPNPFANTNGFFATNGRQAIQRKLNLIRLEEVKYDKLPLGEVVRLLKIESLRRDPEKKGINFMIAPHAETAVQRTQPQLQNLLNGGVGGPGAGGPGGNPGAFQGGAFPPVQLGPDGLPIAQPAPAAAEAVDLGSVIIQLKLNNVSLAEVLDAIVKVADQPIKFTVEDYAVYFTVKAVVQQPLYTKFFKVDPNTFYKGLDGITAGGIGTGSAIGTSSPSLSAADTARISAKAREFFAALGLDITFPKAVFFNERSGLLMVHAALEELLIIEDALHVLNASPPQVIIEAKFIEIADADVKLFERGIRLGGIEITNAPNLKDTVTRVRMMTGWPLGDSRQVPLLGYTNESYVPIAGAICVLTDSQTRALLRSLDSMGNDIGTLPKVTTLSRRRAHFELEAADRKKVFIRINPAAENSPGVTSTNSDQLYLANDVPIGPVLDLIPMVEADGYTLSLDAMVNVTEFLGYDETSVTVPVFINGQKQLVKPPLPRLRIRHMIGRAQLYDGQTLVLAGPKVEELANRADGTTEVASGRATGKQLLVLVTPTIIDPAGNPIRTDADMPFRTNSIPVQKAISPQR